MPRWPTRPRRPRSPQPSPRPGTTPDAPLPAPACLGLTGGIGAGKSAALDAFSRAGAAVLSSDDVVRRLYSEPGVVSAVRERFGPGVIDAGGAVNRPALGASAFGDREATLEGVGSWKAIEGRSMHALTAAGLLGRLLAWQLLRQGHQVT
ncbi:MAG: dephospho-CoA kinase, partial [Miltoncostaeaceae bacterium]